MGAAGEERANLSSPAAAMARASSEAGSPGGMALPSVWRQKSADTMAKSSVQRKALAEHRAAYWKYNEDVRRAQYSMQIQASLPLGQGGLGGGRAGGGWPGCRIGPATRDLWVWGFFGFLIRTAVGKKGRGARAG